MFGLATLPSLRAGGYLLHCLSAGRKLSSLVVIDHRDGNMGSSSYNAVAAASAFGASVTALVAGDAVTNVAEAAANIQGVSKVLLAQHTILKHQLAEPMSLLLQALQKRHNFSHILAPSSSMGKNVLPRAAALLGIQPVSDISKIIDQDTFIRPIFAGNALSTVKYSTPGVRLLTVRAAAFPASKTAASQAAEIQEATAEDIQSIQPAESLVQWLGEVVRKSERPELGSARVVVCGGRALKNAENFKQLEAIADLLGGAVGASRAAVDAGYVPNDLQVGQTGKVVAPELYLGIGISGAIQHLAGMKDSKTIVAINNDAEAPIFQVADYGLVADLFVALPELEKRLQAIKNGS